MNPEEVRDAIRLAVEAAYNRAADAYCEWWDSDDPFNKRQNDFEAHLRAGCPETGTVK
jgi:hypothetical protein